MASIFDDDLPSWPSADIPSSTTTSSTFSVAIGGGTGGKPKSRWFFRSEQEEGGGGGEDQYEEELSSAAAIENSPLRQNSVSSTWRLPDFELLIDNFYSQETEKNKKSKKKSASSCLICECSFDDAAKNLKGCVDDCLNRVLYYECGPNCPTREFCTNKRFQNHQYAKVEPFDAGNKGTGLRALEFIKQGTFIMEYVGEVLSCEQFRRRSKLYAKDPKHRHHYFMALKTDQVIDATRKGNISRFINHSCEPNCETQKWTVGKNLRIGFFATKDVKFMDELTFDYKFQRYG
uniref:Histone-lysine N-methyltransferase n=1 Tax=Romanomermis culicivorax TaxID=13658 RepID=A0A915J9Y7_ROMCU